MRLTSQHREGDIGFDNVQEPSRATTQDKLRPMGAHQAALNGDCSIHALKKQSVCFSADYIKLEDFSTGAYVKGATLAGTKTGAKLIKKLEKLEKLQPLYIESRHTSAHNA